MCQSVEKSEDFLTGYEAGRRAERERIADKLDEQLYDDKYNYTDIERFIDELRQTDSADSGE